MFRIRTLAGARTPAERQSIAEAQALFLSALPGLDQVELAAIPDQLENPFAKRFAARLLVAEDGRGRMRGAALVLHDPELRFAFLDVIAAVPGSGGGAGGALYDRVRDEAASLGATGLYFECLPDDPETCPDPGRRREHAARLRFYERHGARPILGTAYQTPVGEDASEPPYLMFDGLGVHDLPDAATLGSVIHAILDRKYAALCPPDYVEAVVGSVREGGYRLRPPRRSDAPAPAPARARPPVPLVVNDRHDIHHVRERGYVESPVRIDSILRALEPTGLFEHVEPRRFPDRWLTETHDPGLVEYLRRACAEAPEKVSVYPYVFPVRNAARRPRERSVLAGYWCIDTFTPINRNAWPAARRAADCALTAADEVLRGAALAYALVRPPGHHAERRTFGGFCYLCNGAIATQYLSGHGRVAILDVDYHHGNGQQDIFYERGDVLTVSIHGDPSFAYPYFTGFRNETGRGDGADANLNIPLPEHATAADHRTALGRALARIAEFAPRFLVLCIGFDTAKGDPTGTWSLGPEDFRTMGADIASLGLPTVVIQEGGYRVRSLGPVACAFFAGISVAAAARPKPPSGTGAQPRRVWRSAVRPGDPARIRALVAATGRFSAEEIGIAAELAEERIARGRASGYEFVFATSGASLDGYACYGRVPGSETSWDLYWIAVAPERQGAGLGRALLDRVVRAAREAGAHSLYAETSTTPAYAATHAFYRSQGFRLAAEFADFYRAGDGKAVYHKGMLP